MAELHHPPRSTEEVAEAMETRLRENQYRMRVYLVIFGILQVITVLALVAVYLVALGAKHQSQSNHQFGEDNRTILCFNSQHVAHGDPLPKGC